MIKLKSRDGYVFALKDKTAVYDSILYLSSIDSADRYIEITIGEANKLKKELANKFTRSFLF